MGRRRAPTKGLDSVAAKFRSGTQVKLLSPFNDKTIRGEGEGYLTAILYLAPHTIGGVKSVCPHSTAACREVCLFTAGRGKTPRVHDARVRRTEWYWRDRAGFLAQLRADLDLLGGAAEKHGLRLAIRLNGTSDILWEREDFGGGANVFDLYPDAVFYDYTRTPFHHRKVPENWRLVFSLADDPLERAFEHLSAGRSVSAVVAEPERSNCTDTWFALGDRDVQVIDGDIHDLRFLDPAPALVLLKPKGKALRGGPMVRQGLVLGLKAMAKEKAR